MTRYPPLLVGCQTCWHLGRCIRESKLPE